MRQISILGLLLCALGTAVQAEEVGQITGVVVDAQTGEALVGATVYLEGTDLGTIGDVEGRFQLAKVPAGIYVLVSSMIGYHKATIIGLTVKPGEVTNLEIALEPDTIELQEEVVVEAKALRYTSASLLKERQKAPAISDAISAEAISRSGSGDAAEAVSRVTGASVVSGKYVYIRGLGDRYTSIQLNGFEIPSADPNRRTVAMDLFPTALLDRIAIAKSFTPDKPGNFTGGYIDIGTKTFPEKFTISSSISSTYNSQASFNDQFLTYEGGKWDWLGIDDGTRALPIELARDTTQIPDISQAWTNPELAKKLDRLSKSFSPVMAPTTQAPPLDYSASASVGNQLSLFKRQLGFMGTLTYSRSHTFYDQGISARYQLTSRTATTLNNNFLLTDSRGNKEVTLGGLLTAAYQLTPAQELGFSYIYNRQGEDMARYLVGPFPRDLSEEATYETRVLHFTERRLKSIQFSGKHQFPFLRNLYLTWAAAQATNRQHEPDLRFFTDNYTLYYRGADTLYSYAIRPDIYPVPTRYFRQLDETNREFQLNLSLPFRQWHRLNSTFKFGGSYLDKERIFVERRYEFRQDKIRYDGKPLSFFSSEKVGIIDSTRTGYRFGNYLKDATQQSGSFDGDQQLGAGYAMVELPLTLRLRAISGARLEITRLKVQSRDSTQTAGVLSENDLLPSLNLVYEVYPGMNLRAAYSRTLARPTFRELAPYASFDFVGAYIFIGNPDLKRTLVDNYDLRWEWFGQPGEIYAFSAFVKRFSNPIERAIRTINGEVQFQNVDQALVQGIELEIRQGLDRFIPWLPSFTAGLNLTLIHSEVSIPASELQIIRSLIPEASDKRPLQGQSPYLFNLDLNYEELNRGISASLSYNRFGRRLSEVSLGGTPNVYEKPRGLLEVTFAKKFNRVYQIKFNAKNLLNSKVEKVYPFKGTNYIAESYSQGRSYSFALSYAVGQ